MDEPEETTEEVDPAESAEEEVEINDHDIFENYDIITIALDRGSHELPELDLGNTSPWAAIALLKSAIHTLEMLVPPLDVRYRGDIILRQMNGAEFEIVDTDSIEFDDDDDT